MSGGVLLTKLTIWIALAGYFAGAITYALARGRPRRDAAARLGWTAACAALLAHVACAFHVHHSWSHAAAYVDTARQTGEVFGLEWGGGLYVNYALAALWIADVGWWWAAGLAAYRRRPRALTFAWHAFLFFIVFNATVVFEGGFVRRAGAALCAALVCAWLIAARRAPKRERIDQQSAAAREGSAARLDAAERTFL
jgi:hypothetical protein